MEKQYERWYNTEEIKRNAVIGKMSPQKKSNITSEDQAFFEAFYIENRNLIFYFASKLAGTDGCEDLVHDTLVRLICHIPSLRQISDNKKKVANYLFQTVQSEYIDQHRKNKHEKNLTVSIEDVPCQQSEESLQELEAALEKAQELDMVKDGLTQQEWMLLHKRYILGYSAQELGQMHDCSASSIRMTLSRTRKKAKEILLKNQKNGGADRG